MEMETLMTSSKPNEHTQAGVVKEEKTGTRSLLSQDAEPFVL